MSKTVLRGYTQTVAPGEIWQQGAIGEMILIDKASYPVNIEFLDQYGTVIGEAQGIEKGSSIGPDTEAVFHQVNLTSDIAQEIKIFVFRGKVNIPRIVGETTALPASTMTAAAVVVGAGAVVQVAAADTDRLFLNVYNPDTAAASVWLKPDTAAAIGGLNVAPGGNAGLQYSGVLYAYNPTAAAITLQVSEMLK